ncbi:hypothetical protein [Lacinutrix himadriensis]|uniref:hypothetical protein n=1 Tax=Lacinutrix himadriensis TaxID=641549 RepID=UPI0006E27AD2|nr:hypothetical protein [Lacinutrix himadriensis]
MCIIETVSNFFDQEFLKDIISALIGTGTALLIFYLTILSDRKKEKKKSQEENDNRVRNFSNLVKSSNGHVETISANLDEMVSEYEKNNLDFQLLKFSPNKSFNRLEKLLKNENYFLSYINKFGESKIDTFNNISSKVDYFNMQIDQLWSMVEKSQNFDFERKKRFKLQVSELMNLTAWITKQPELLTADDIDKLNSYIKEFYENITDETDLNYFYEYLRKVLENVLIKYTDNQIILGHLPKFRDTSVLFREIKLQNDNHKDDLKQISETLKSTLEKYKTDASELIK